ncbi:MAG: carbohydrate kinase [Clostridia bacterium]|nr:carbohydrate kinase [Clostridia bacterium]
MIICVGEILADMIGSEKDGAFVYERKAGGAPFNVACGIKKFGGKAKFAGSVGADLIGDFLTEFAADRGLDGLIIDRQNDANTTLAFVQLDGCGERSFCFYRKNTADYRLPRLSDDVLKEVNIVHVGSLMLSEDCGLDYAENLIKRAHSLNKTVSFDVNFRSDIFRDERAATERYRAILELADVLKFSEDEIGIFGEEYINSKLNEKLICISLGADGSEWRYCGNRGKVKSISVKPVDTTGAGDAFFAGILCGIDGVPKSGWTESFLNGVLARANVCGALATLGKGAIDCLPDASRIDEALGQIKS